MEWVNDYIGLPWLDNGRTRDGCDCYGLVRLLLAEQFNVYIDAEDQFYTTVADSQPEIGEKFIEAKQGLHWQQIPDPSTANPGDVLLYQLPGKKFGERLWHCSLYIGLGEMLHVREGCNAIVDRVNDPRWRNRLEGAYRYVGV